jgi:Protein of unknown function (DUF3540)
MSAVVSKFRRTSGESGEYLGGAQVNAVSSHEVVVSLPDGEIATAELAFALPYTPAIGDLLLVIGRNSKYYAIGILHGNGQTDLSFQGNVRLRSVNGKLSLSGDKGVDIQGPDVNVITGSLRMIARDVFHSFESMYQHVSALLRVHAGEAQTLVERGTYTQAKTAAIMTKDAVTINGSEVHIG